MENNRIHIPTAAADRNEVETISTLPDQIVHDEIFDRLSTAEIVRTGVLSQRWNQLWRSYPTIEFRYKHYATGKRWDPQPAETAKRHIAAALEKLSQRHVRSVRIYLDNWSYDWSWSESCRNFLGRVVELSAKNSPEVIDISLGDHRPQTYCIPQSLLRYRGLKVLKLQNCYFENYDPLASLGSSLKVLCLRYVEFTDDRILNSMIESASLLEELTLSLIRGLYGRFKDGWWRFQVRNHPSLKVVKVEQCELKGFEIAGARSLQVLNLACLEEGDLDVSFTPNLKVLDLRRIPVLTEKKLNELISRLPLLEKLVLQCGDQVGEFKIVHSDKLMEIEIDHNYRSNKPPLIEIDAPRLTNFVYTARCGRFPTILFSNKTTSTAAPVSFYFELCNDCFFTFEDLQQFICKVSQFRLTLRISGTFRSQGIPELPVQIIECLKFKSSYLVENSGFIDMVFRICRPKSLTIEVNILYRSQPNHPSSGFETLCNELKNRGSSANCSTAACKCWRHRLKDVKIVASESSEQDKEKLVEVTSDIISYLVAQQKVEEIRFILDWDC